MKREDLLRLSFIFNAIFFLSVLYLLFFSSSRPSRSSSPASAIQGHPQVWYGGHPADSHPGSCWCGGLDRYCMCTPNLAVDLIIVSGISLENQPDSVWLVQRRDTSKLATMGGFVDVNETVEAAVRRELKEEMSVDLDRFHNIHQPKLFGVYSDPRRDSRRRTVAVVYVVQIDQDHFHPKARNDAKQVIKVPLQQIQKKQFFADHKTILTDYVASLKKEASSSTHETGDFANDIQRSTCTNIPSYVAKLRRGAQTS